MKTTLKIKTSNVTLHLQTNVWI